MPSPEGTHSSFVDAVCTELVQSLNQSSVTQWTANTRPAAQSTPDAATTAIFRLTLEGPLRGYTLLAISLADLPQLDPAETEDPPEQTLANLFSTCASALQARLFTAADGTITCTRVDTIDDDAPAATYDLQLTSKDRTKTLKISMTVDKSLTEWMPASSAVNPPAQTSDAANLDLVLDVELDVTLRFGQRQLPLREVLELKSGAVVELDRQVDEPVELVLDGKVVALGEAVIIDGNYGIRITQVVQSLLSV